MALSKHCLKRRAAVLVALGLCAVGRGAEFAGGTGGANDPYLIATAEQFNAVGADPNLWNKHFKLVADIDLGPYAGASFNMIGHHFSNADNKPFIGVFDGNDRTISNFRYACSDTDRIGLFGFVRQAKIQNLRLVDPNIVAEGGSYVGGLVGYADYPTLTNCCVEGGQVSGDRYVGGLVGYGSYIYVSSCHTATTVQGDTDVGGLAGWADEGSFTLCHANGAVTGCSSVGGFLGRGAKTIDSCSSAGSVVGEDDVGGFVGYSYATITACCSTAAVTGTHERAGGFAGRTGDTVSHCYATGPVQGASGVAGFVGSNSGRISLSYCTGSLAGDAGAASFTIGGSVYLCYWDVETSGIADGTAARGRTTAQMQSAATYRGWGYGGHWVLDEGNDYPRLAWEGEPGQVLVDEPASYGGGTGQPDDPYLIQTAPEFLSIAYHREDFDKHFALTNDIDLSMVDPDEILPIGTSGIPFAGSFAGNGHAISHLTCRWDTQAYMGLFGYLDAAAHVTDVDLIDVVVSGSQYVGALAGYSLGTIERCSVAGSVVGRNGVGGLAGYHAGTVGRSSVAGNVVGSYSVGGLAGYSRGTITACFSAGDVTGDSVTGGLIGYNDGDIAASYSVAAVVATEEVGGLVGTNGRNYIPAGLAGPGPGAIPDPPDTRISSCYCLGSVVGQKAVGGLVGHNGGLIVVSYAAAPVTGAPLNIPPARSGRGGSVPVEEPTTVGGLVGRNGFGSTLLSYWDVERAGQSASAGGRGKTTEQMTSARTFRGWDYPDQWLIDDGVDYPHLAWEESAGQPIEADPNRYSGGTGEPNAPYRIGGPSDLMGVGSHPADWNKSFVLVSDIDLAGVDSNELYPIGVYGLPFTGVFDGNNHTIANFSYVADTENCVGLFGSVGSEVVFWSHARLQDVNGMVLDLNLENVDVSARSCAGGLAGFSGGTISGCSVSGRVTVAINDAGGLTGCSVGSVLNCSASCDIEAERAAGGLVGYGLAPVAACWCEARVNARRDYAGGLIGLSGNTVEFCHSTGAVTGQSYVGGLIGRSGGDVLACSAMGDVVGSRNVGGLVGQNGYAQNITRSLARTNTVGERQVGGLAGYNSGTIADCYAEGRVEGVDSVAGLVGQHSGTLAFCYSACAVGGQQNVAGLAGDWSWGDIESCFWDTSISGLDDAVAYQDPDPEGAVGLSTAQMQNGGIFVNAGWDFETIWMICEGKDYPRLRWEQVACHK